MANCGNSTGLEENKKTIKIQLVRQKSLKEQEEGENNENALQPLEYMKFFYPATVKNIKKWRKRYNWEPTFEIRKINQLLTNLALKDANKEKLQGHAGTQTKTARLWLNEAKRREGIIKAKEKLETLKVCSIARKEDNDGTHVITAAPARQQQLAPQVAPINPPQIVEIIQDQNVSMETPPHGVKQKQSPNVTMENKMEADKLLPPQLTPLGGKLALSVTNPFNRGHISGETLSPPQISPIYPNLHTEFAPPAYDETPKNPEQRGMLLKRVGEGGELYGRTKALVFDPYYDPLKPGRENNSVESFPLIALPA
jgi:hypothetical protein